MKYAISREEWVKDFKKNRGLRQETIDKLNDLLEKAPSEDKVEKCNCGCHIDSRGILPCCDDCKATPKPVRKIEPLNYVLKDLSTLFDVDIPARQKINELIDAVEELRGYR